MEVLEVPALLACFKRLDHARLLKLERIDLERAQENGAGTGAVTCSTLTNLCSQDSRLTGCEKVP